MTIAGLILAIISIIINLTPLRYNIVLHTMGLAAVVPILSMIFALKGVSRDPRPLHTFTAILSLAAVLLMWAKFFSACYFHQ